MKPKINNTCAVLTEDVARAYEQLGAGLNLGLLVAKDILCGYNEKGEFKFDLPGSFIRRTGAKNSISFDQIPFAELAARQRSLASAYPKPKPQALTVAQPESSRLVIGMGQASVYENGFTLHPVFGCPYLPGSSLKGITRRTYIDEYHDGEEAVALADQTFCDLFGCTGLTKLEKLDKDGKENPDKDGKPIPYKAESHYYKFAKQQGLNDLGDRRGALIFFDALPTRAPKVVVDILTPHYSPYYKDALPPADIYNPVPVNFLAVEGGEFEVLLALDAGRGPVAEAKDGEERDGFARAVSALKIALTEDGIGGKTTVGYGRLVDKRAEEKRLAKLKAEQDAVEENERLKRIEEERAKMTINAAEISDGKEIFADVLKSKLGVITVKPLINNLKGTTEFSFKYSAGLEVGSTVTILIRVQKTKRGKQIQSVQFVRIPQ